LRFAGARERYLHYAREMLAALETSQTALVTDPGCALSLRETARESGKTAPFATLVELVHERRDSLATLPPDIFPARGEVRYHDACALGRGLGLYDPPREVLARIVGKPVSEFARSRTRADCSGGGGLLPVTMPLASRKMAEERVLQHEER